MKSQNPAIFVSTQCLVFPKHASKKDKYCCPNCNEPVFLRKGDKRAPHFSHYSSSNCNYYNNESVNHMNAKQKIKEILENRKNNIYVWRTCTKCDSRFHYEIDPIDPTSIVKDEYPFVLDKKLRRADIACINESNDIEFIFEICYKNPTECEKRPEPWFELDANSVCELEIDDCNIINVECIRKTYCEDTQNYGYCKKCEQKYAEENKGIIYFNQRGAGCGKTYESIQLIKDIKFENKTTWIYLTKMRSAKFVIYNELKNQLETPNAGFIGKYTFVSESNAGNQHKIIIKRMIDEKHITIIIGTMDSFIYALRGKAIKPYGKNQFIQIATNISNGNMYIETDGSIHYASSRPKLTHECFIVIDEGQDLDKQYVTAFETIINNTGIDVYIIGDKLQSILSENNAFTYLLNSEDSDRIEKNYGENIVKRFHNEKFIDFVNDIVDFKKHGVSPIVGICDGNCNYQHENHIIPYTIDSCCPNIYKSDEKHIDYIDEMIGRITTDMTTKIIKYGYLPKNFCFIFPVVSNNEIIARLYPALQEFWKTILSQPCTYTELFIENMKLDNYDNYWDSKIKHKYNDIHVELMVQFHKSESNQTINLDESKHSTRIMSIHASKGTGCECVYLLGLTERSLSYMSSNETGNLKYESLLHVGLTRHKKYLYVGVDGTVNDDICKRFCKYNCETMSNPDFNMKKSAKPNDLCKSCENLNLYEAMNEISNFREWECSLYPEGSNSDRNIGIDWGHHIIRACAMRTAVYCYMIEHVDQCGQQTYATLKTLIDSKIVYCEHSIYKQKIKELYKTIEFNIKNNNNGNKKNKLLVLPILLFDENKGNEYSKYSSILKNICGSIVGKLKTNSYKKHPFCPIESIVFDHLIGLTRYPKLNTQIMDIYRILVYSDECFNVNQIDEHETYYKCCCKDCFSNRTSLFVRPHEKISTGISKHYSALQKINSITEKIINTHKNNDVKYKSTNLSTKKKLISVSGVDYIGFYNEDNKSKSICIKLCPQLNSMNMFDVYFELLIASFFILLRDTENVICYIISLDFDEPIQINFTDIIRDNKEKLTELVKTMSFDTLKHNNTLGYKCVEHYRNTVPKGESYLKRLIDDNNSKEKSHVKWLHSYFVDWIKSLDQDISNTQNNQRKTLRENLKNENWVIDMLNQKLIYELEYDLGIKNDSGWDSDSE